MAIPRGLPASVEETVELLVDETQQQEGTITETGSGSCCGLDDGVAAKQWAQITS